MLSNRLSSIIESYTINISTRVSQMKDSGIKVINLSIGEPDFNIPEIAKNTGIESLSNNLTKYNMASGLKILREEICNKLLIENNCDYSIDEIVVSSGAKNSITNALLALTNPGDDVLVPKPYWVSYPEMIKLVNANPIFINTQKENLFKVTIEDLQNNITPKTKLLILNNPSNPTGVIYSKQELVDIVDFCLENNIYIISDEIYERICFNNEFTSIASISNDAKDISVTINGFSKSVAMTGLRLGYSASNKTIAKAISTIQGHLISHPNLTAQYIGYSALKDCSKDILDTVEVYKNRRDLICSKLDLISDINYIYPQGAFYVFIDISKLKDRLPYNNSFSLEFCNKLLDDYNVATVPGIAFGIDDYIRISFACKECDFLEGIDRLSSFIDNLKN